MIDRWWVVDRWLVECGVLDGSLGIWLMGVNRRKLSCYLVLRGYYFMFLLVVVCCPTQ